MKKILIIILLIIGIVLIAIGIGLTLSLPESKKEEISNEPSETNNENISNITEINRKHCLNSLCLSDVKIINYSPQFNIISGTITNESNEVLPSDCFKFIFEINEEIIEKNFCYPDMEAGISNELELQFTDPRVIHATDYSLQVLTEEEKKNFLNTTS